MVDNFDLLCLLATFLQPELEPQPEVDPAEVLELEHDLEVVAPHRGSQTKVNSTGIVLCDNIQMIQDALILQPNRLPVDTHARGVDNKILTKVILVTGMGAQFTPRSGKVLGDDCEIAIKKAIPFS